MTTLLQPTGIFNVVRVCLFVGFLGYMSATQTEEVASPRLGETATRTNVAKHNTMIFPDGEGLPPGSGGVEAGEKLYLQHCIRCHGANGRGGSGGELAGGHEPLTSDYPDQNIGTYWPFATTLFDFIRRAMPMGAPGSLSSDEVYGLTAYLLYENAILARDVVLDADTLAALKMPNRDGFMWIDAQPPNAP